ncbi:hypothetical protein BG011_005529 [Mortierella polycephala]|uniref:Uncharacterized protein n=1 Tax=Mortierella polycephala TaxID=41804 RepID=A0A9P6PV72_9FUNG|nr:hypothetical protein BG011_005529 [Mortierella polycephala]
MDCKVLNPGECLVKYFEDNKYSVVQFTDLQQFVPTTIPFLEFELAAGQKFLKNGGVVNALSYLESGKVKRKFSWHRWGTAQDQELNLDMHKHKPISLPLISDKTFSEKPQQPQTGVASSTSSSPTTSTRQDTDNETEGKNRAMHAKQSLQQYQEQSTSSPAIVSSAGKGAGLKNGLQRALASVASTSSPLFPTTLLPSPVSLNGLATEPNIDETEFGLRPIKGKGETTAAVTKDSPTISTATGRSRSRRGSRENENKAGATTSTLNSAAAIGTKDTSRRSRNASEQSAASTSPTTSQPSHHASAMTTANSTASVTAPVITDASKKQKSTSELAVSTELQNGVSESGSVTTRSSRQGSAEPSVSPRSTRHSSRTSRASESNPQEHDEGTTKSGEAALAAPIKLQTQRMTRQRSAPKSANSLSVSPAEKVINEGVKDEPMEMASPVIKDEQEPAILTMEVKSSETREQNNKAEQQGDKGESSAMDTDEQDSQIRPDQPPLSIPASSLASSASSTASPSSLGPDEGHVSSSTSASSSSSSNSTLLIQQRRTMDYNFEFLLPKLAIGSKEREAFYETCMDHLQRLRQEHRRLKDILKSSDYLPKGRRATRSSPQYHSHHHRHNHHHHQSHLEEKPSRKRSPAPLRTNSLSSTGSHKEANTSRASSAKSKAESNSTAAQPTVAGVAGAAGEDNGPGTATATESQSQSQSPPPPPPTYQGSTPSSDILTSNISTTTRRSAAAAAAAALTATVSRPSRQSHHSNGKGSKKRTSTASSASSSTTASAEAETAAGTGDDSGQVTTRAKRRLR